MEWKGKAAVITGASSGIGQQLARRLAAQGANLIIAARRADRLEEVANQLRRESSGKILTASCDVADREQVRELARLATKEFGKVDLVCANAGATTAGPYLDHTDEDWDWSLGVNLHGATNTLQVFLPDMVARGSGTIMITGSQTTFSPDWYVQHGPYIAAKAGLLALTMALRQELIGTGVQITCLVPGATITEIAAEARKVTEGGDLVPGYPVPPSDPRFKVWMTADEVAERALAGLRKDVPMITTHAAMKPIVEEYFSRILAAYDEAAELELELAGAQA